MERRHGGERSRGGQRAAAAGHGVVPAGRALPPRRCGHALHAAVGRTLVPGATAAAGAAPAGPRARRPRPSRRACAMTRAHRAIHARPGYLSHRIRLGIEHR